MTFKQFFKRNYPLLNQTNIELYAHVPRNTISHVKGSENRSLPLAYEDAIMKVLNALWYDIGQCMVHYEHNKSLTPVKKKKKR